MTPLLRGSAPRSFGVFIIRDSTDDCEHIMSRGSCTANVVLIGTLNVELGLFTPTPGTMYTVLTTDSGSVGRSSG